MGRDDSDNFDEFAETYHTTLSRSLRCGGTTSQYFSEYRVRIIKEMITGEDGAILDYGCGDGTTALFFREHFPRHKVSGVDISGKSIGIAAERHIDNSEFTTLDSGVLPFPQGCFDLVFMANVLHHIPKSDHELILVECLRVLKEKGIIAVFEHNPLNPVTRRVVKECVFDREATLVLPWDMGKMLLLSGFQDIRISFHLFFPRYKPFGPVLCLERFLRGIPLGAQYCVAAAKGEAQTQQVPPPRPSPV